MKLVAAITAVFLMGAAEPTSQQFGLRCELNALGTTVHYSNRYSLDLNRGVWCGVSEETNTCHEDRTVPLVRVDAAELELLPAEFRNGRARPAMVVNRTTGILTSDLLTGPCTKVDFTPMPQARF
ncbi:MAG: hypothetical protein ACK4MH_06595 [Brevundimonas sp.]|uniref:hypothetical protein n=1 Tax=Brevundimonas sp. TaxID=1871086 RepID=UPI00391D3303